MAFKDKQKAKEYYKSWRESKRGKEYTKKYSKEYYKRTRGTPEARRAFHMKQKYGISMEDYAKLLASQNYVCAICGGKQVEGKGLNGTLSVDHNHDTGEVRGLLCQTCNLGLGAFKDNITLLAIASEYLKKYES